MLSSRSRQIITLLRNAGDIASTFLCWWAGELSSLVPSWVIRLLGSNDRIMLLHPRATEVSFVAADKASSVTVALTETDISASLRHAIQQADGVHLVLPRGKVLRRSLHLPQTAASELASAVSFLIERETPFLLDQARYAFRVVGRNPARKTLQVEIGVTARAALEQIQIWIERMGIRLSSIRMEGEEASTPFDFLLTRGSTHGRLWLREPWRLVLAAALVALLIGPIWVATEVHSEAASLSAAVASRSAEARKLAAIRDELQQATQKASFIVSRLAPPRRIEVLATLADSLPDDTWIFSLELAGGDLKLGGFSADVPTLIGRLQTAHGFTAPELTSPVVHDAGGKRDRFDLLVHVSPVLVGQAGP